jgi:hypothetical protein
VSRATDAASILLDSIHIVLAQPDQWGEIFKKRCKFVILPSLATMSTMDGQMTHILEIVVCGRSWHLGC